MRKMSVFVLIVVLLFFKFTPCLAQVPAIFSFAPSVACFKDTITINGTNFSSVTSVKIGGNNMLGYTVINSNVIRAVRDKNNAGYISVTNLSGTASSASILKTGSSFGTYSYIASYTDSSVWVINNSTKLVVSKIKVQKNPEAVCVSPLGDRVYVVNDSDSSISVINTTTNLVINTFKVGPSPWGICLNNDGSKLYVAIGSSNNVKVYNTSTFLQIATITAGTSPNAVSLTPDGTKGYIVNSGSNSVTYFNAITNTPIANIPVGTLPQGISITPDGTKAFITNSNSNNVSVINTTTNTVISTISTGQFPCGIAINPAGTKVFVANGDNSNVSVIDAVSNSVITNIAVGNVPYGISISPDGSYAYVCNVYSNSISVIDANTNTVSSTFSVCNRPYSFGSFIASNVINACTPTINSFTPTSAIQGVSIAIKGSNFIGATSVKFGNVEAGLFTVINDSTINATVANGASGSVSVTTSTGGTGNLAGFIFNPPSITSFNPTSANNGSIINIFGAGLNATTAVKIGGIPVKSFMIINTNNISVVLGEGATGSVEVTTTQGVATMPGFICTSPPTITQINPPNGCGTTLVTISGSNFINANAVTINNKPVAIYSVINSNTIVATIDSISTGKITVTNPYGNATSNDSFNIGSNKFGDYLYVFSYITNTQLCIDVFDVNTKVKIKRIALTGAPVCMKLSPFSNKLYVSCYVGSRFSHQNLLYTINTANNQISDSLFSGVYVESMCLSKDGHYIYLLDYDSYEIIVIDAFKNAVLTKIPVSPNPEKITINANGTRIFVGTSQFVDVIDLASLKVIKTIRVSAHWSICSSQDGTKFYSSGNTYNGYGLHIVDVNTGNIIKEDLFGSLINQMTLSKDNKTIYLSESLSSGGSGSVTQKVFSSIDAIADTIKKRFSLGYFQTWISFTENQLDSNIYLANIADSVIKVFNTSSFQIIDTFRAKANAWGTNVFLDVRKIKLPCPPEIYSFTPASGNKGSVVTIKGKRFTTTTNVSFGNMDSKSFNVINDSTIVATVGSGASGNITVSSSGGGASIGKFIVSSSNITSFYPTKGYTGSCFTINGSGLKSTVAVMVGNTNCSFTIIDSNVINVIVNATQSGIIKVITTSDTLPSLIEYKVQNGNYAYLTEINFTPKIRVLNLNSGKIDTTLIITNSPSLNPLNGVVISKDGNRTLFGIDSYDNNMVVINNRTKQVVSIIDPYPYAYTDKPTSYAINSNGTKIYFIGKDSNTVYVVDVNTATLIKKIYCNQKPDNICLSSDDSKLFVITNGASDSSLSIINTLTNSIISITPAIRRYFSKMAVSPNGNRLYITYFKRNENYTLYLDVIDANTGSVLFTHFLPTYNNTSFRALCVHPNNQFVYFTTYIGEYLAVYNVATNSVSYVNSITRCNNIAFTNNSNNLYVSIAGDNTNPPSINTYNPNNYQLIDSVSYYSTIYPSRDFLLNITPAFANASAATSNSPVNIGDTLKFSLTGSNLTEGNITWTGPNGFISNSINPYIPNIQPDASGSYTATIMGSNCSSTLLTTNVVINGGVSVSGSLRNPKGNYIKGVSIKLNGSLKLQNQSYLYTVNPTLPQIIQPTKNNDISKANGINATDVLFVQRHILGSPKLNSAYKIIAADVNGDKVVNATDLLRIKRLILGTDTTFTKGSGANKVDRLWEFVDSAYQFPDTTNPFPFKDSISFTSLTSNKTNQTFIGVKLGDVNYDWNPLVAKGVEAKPVELVYHVRSAQNVLLNTTNGADFQSDLIKIPFTVKNFKDITAMQYTIHFNNKDYEFVGIENNKLDIDYSGKQANQNGNISFLWTDKNALEKTLEDGTELFVLVLVQKGIGNLEFGISDAITDIAAWDKDYNQHNIILTKQENPNNNLSFIIDQLTIFPNPAKEFVTVQCKGMREVRIINSLGQIIQQYKNTTEHKTVNTKQLNKGLYIVQVKTNKGEVKTEKSVVE